MRTVLLAIIAWRLVRRLALPAILIALVMLLLHSRSIGGQRGRHAGGAVERIIRPVKHDLQQTLGKVVGP